MARRLRLATRGLMLVLLAAGLLWACRGALRDVEPAPVRPDPASWTGDGLHIAWLGHASVLIRLGGTTLLTDPAFFERIGLSIGPITIGPKRMVASALTAGELPPIDAVVLSHAHMDSLDRPSLAALDAPLVVVPERTRDLVDDLGFERIVELRWGDTLDVGDLTLEAVPVAHWGRRWPWERWRGYNGYLLSADGASVLFASDTAYTPAFRSIGSRSPLLAAILGNGAYDPWVWNHATPEQVWQMFGECGARYLLPIHWDTFALGKEPPGDAMRRLLAAAGDETERVVLRQIGETWSLPRAARNGRERGSPAGGRVTSRSR